MSYVKCGQKRGFSSCSEFVTGLNTPNDWMYSCLCAQERICIPLSQLMFVSIFVCVSVFDLAFSSFFSWWRDNCRTLQTIFYLSDLPAVFMSGLNIIPFLAVRLHDSISEEGFHYLVFDLWVYSVHAHSDIFINACDCGLFVYANNFSPSVSSFDSFLPSPFQCDRRRAFWRHCSQRVLQWGWCQVSASCGPA